MDNSRYKFNRKEKRYLKMALFAAYYDCRRHKRNTYNAIRFELNQEEEVRKLYEEILSGSYQISPSRAFIVFQPVQREIFAADFRDRVIHHYLIGRLEPVFERLFIYDSYSCRKGKGTLFGVSRLTGFIRSCSRNYTRDCYVLKVDIQGFFMNIRKEILLQKALTVIEKYYKGFDKELLKDLCRTVILHNPVPDCIVKGSRKDWEGLPAGKSLFSSNGRVGIPIGNLTSQVFANLYLNEFDHFVKRELKQKYYGRYVDDCVFVSPSREELQQLIVRLSDCLKETLGLDLHPKKVYLQHYRKGVLFVGMFVKPFCRYVGKRVQHKMNRKMINDYQSLRESNAPSIFEEMGQWLSSVNSYLGICRHGNTYHFRTHLANRLNNNLFITFDKELHVAKKTD
jgi:retron-type reverse transcriptase